MDTKGWLIEHELLGRKIPNQLTKETIKCEVHQG